MANRWRCGFELQVTNGTGAAVEWQNSYNLPTTVNTTQARSGQACLRIGEANTGSTSNLSRGLEHRPITGTANKALYARVNVKFEWFPTVSDTAILVIENETFGFNSLVVINSLGELQLFVSSDSAMAFLPVGSLTAPLNLNQYYTIELFTDTTSPNAWVVAARVDGVEFSRDNAFNGGTSYACVAAFFGSVPGGTISVGMYIDDLAINDTSSTVQNSWPGLGKLVRVNPISAGDNAADVGTFADVDETTPNSLTDYITLANNGSVASYQLTNPATVGIPSDAIIVLVSPWVWIRDAVSASTGYRMQLKSASGGTIAQSAAADSGNTTWRLNPLASVTLLNQYSSYVDPTTGLPWTVTGTNSLSNMQLGVNSTTANDIWISTLWAMVEYVESAGGGGIALSLNLADGASLSEAIAKVAGKNTTDAATASDSRTSQASFSRFLNDAGSAVEVAFKSVGRAVVDSVATIDLAGKAVNLGKTELASTSDSAARAVGKTFTETASVADTASKSVVRSLTDSAVVTDSTSKRPVLGKSDSVASTDAVAKNAGKGMSDAATSSEVLSRQSGYSKTLNDAAGTTDALSRQVALSKQDQASASDEQDRASGRGVSLVDAVIGSDSRSNLVSNPSFEIDTAGWQGFLSTVGRTTSEHYSGNASLEVVGAEAVVAYFNLDLAVGATYLLQVRMKGPVGVPVYLTSRGNGASEAITLTGGWDLVHWVFTAAQGEGSSLECKSDNQFVTIFVDAACLEIGPTLRPYFDGDDLNAAWTGVAHASTSTSVAVSRALGKSVSESLPVVDSIGLQLAIRRGLTDNATPADAASLAVGLNKQETVSTGDALSQSSGTGVSLTDTAATTDASSKAVGARRSDAVNVADQQARSVAKSLLDAASMSEAIAKRFNRALVDAVTLADIRVTQAGRVLVLSDGVAAADSASLSRGLQLALTDAVSAEDAVAIAVTLLLQDEAATSDSLSTSGTSAVLIPSDHVVLAGRFAITYLKSKATTVILRSRRNN